LEAAAAGHLEREEPLERFLRQEAAQAAAE
jgi:hypothetical protein